MSIWASSDQSERVYEAMQMLKGQQIIDGFEVDPGAEKRFRVKLPSGYVHMDDVEASMFALGAVVARFGDIARMGG